MRPETGRSTMFAIVGGYLLYLAYELFRSLRDGEATTMPRALQIVVIIAFAGLGVTLIGFAWRVWKKGRTDQDKNPVELEGRAQAETEVKDQDPEAVKSKENP